MPRLDWIINGNLDDWVYYTSPSWSHIGPQYDVRVHVSYYVNDPRRTHVTVIIQNIRTLQSDFYRYFPYTNSFNRDDDTYGDFPYDTAVLAWEDFMTI